MKGDGVEIRNAVARPISTEPAVPALDGYIEVGQGDLQRLAVSCADAPPYIEGEDWPTAEGMVEKLQGVLKSVSPRFGATVNMMEQHGGCQFWPKSDKPLERFTVSTAIFAHLLETKSSLIRSERRSC